MYIRIQYVHTHPVLTFGNTRIIRVLNTYDVSLRISYRATQAPVPGSQAVPRARVSLRAPRTGRDGGQPLQNRTGVLEVGPSHLGK